MVKQSTLRARASNASLQAAGSITTPSSAEPLSTSDTHRQPFYEYANPENGASPFTTIPVSGARPSFATPSRPRPVSESFSGKKLSLGQQLPIPSRATSVNQNTAPRLPPLPPKILESEDDSTKLNTAANPPDLRHTNALNVRRNPLLQQETPAHTTITPWGTISSSPHFSKPTFGVPAFSASSSVPRVVSKDKAAPHLTSTHKSDERRNWTPAKAVEEYGQEIDSKKTEVSPEDYTKPFCQFLSENPTVFHAVGFFSKRLAGEGFKKLSERSLWTEELKKGGKYYVERNGSSLIAFTVGNAYKPGNGVAMIAGHIDAITARLKPVSSKRTTAGYVQLGVAPYAGGLNPTWWDRDLSIGGKVLVKDSKTGKISTQLVKLDWPIARVPTLAPHFGVGMLGQQNPETQAVPIIGLDNSDINSLTADFETTTIGGGEKAFVATQPPRLVKAIAGELKIQDTSSIINWELELFDLQPATVGGIEKDLIFGGRIDDKLCSYAAIEGLLASSPLEDSSVINMVALFDDEEIGSLLRQGARGNFMPSVIERIVETFSPSAGANLMAQTYARSFLISADVTHAVNPNFLGSYLEGHSPRLNVGPAVQADGNGHTTTDSVSTAFLGRIAEKCGSKLQVFMIRNDSRSGGTVGPTLSSSMGVRAIDCGIPQLSMHSIRATTGSLDPGLGVKLYKGFFDHFETVDAEFED